MKGPDEAAEVHAEGVRAITAPFLKLPVGFGRLTMYLCRSSIEQCRHGGQEPDEAILGPVVEKLRELEQQQGSGAKTAVVSGDRNVLVQAEGSDARVEKGE